MTQLDLIDYLAAIPAVPVVITIGPNENRGWPMRDRYSVEYFAAEPRTFHACKVSGVPMCSEITRQPGLLHHRRQTVNCEACQDALCSDFLRRGRLNWNGN